MNKVNTAFFKLALAASLIGGSGGAFAGNNIQHTVTPGTVPWFCGFHHPCPKPGTTQPTCKGPHKGPNGVMIQCD